MAEQIQIREEEQKKEVSLEEMFQKLDEIMTSMDDREVSLEDAFSLYEKGMQMIKQCNERLDFVEKKMLVIAQDGSEIPFED